MMRFDVKTAIIALTSYEVGVSLLDLVGGQWYINAPSLCAEVFYFGVSAFLTFSYLTKKREAIFIKQKHDIIYKTLLSINLALACINVSEAIRAVEIKYKYVWDLNKDLDVQYGEIERLIHEDYTNNLVHILGAGVPLAILFAVIMVKMPYWLNKN